MSGAPVSVVLAALRSVTGHQPRRNGAGSWEARCPAHGDRRPSLTVSAGADGRALICCHRGCRVESIARALGLTLRDLMASPGSPSPKPRLRPAGRGIGDGDIRERFETHTGAVAELERRHGPRSATWIYHDAAGEPVGVVVRWNREGGAKVIRPVSRTRAGWVIGAMPRPRPLYGLGTLADPGQVFVCEGEPACDALREIGLTATTSSGGSNAAFHLQRSGSWLRCGNLM